MIMGIDEVGRGPWAGPLVVGAVVLGSAKIEGLIDSKKLSKRRREELYDEIVSRAACYALGWVHADEIDRIGLSAALTLATKRAVEQISVPYHEIIIDGTVNFLQNTNKGPHVTLMKKADVLISAVSAASIVAKVARDNYMIRMDELYPVYGFQSHVGYGTARHREAIRLHGVTPIHRLSFAPLAAYRKESPLRTEIITGDISEPALSRTGTTTQIGGRAEDVVAEYLKRHDHTILERNWKTKFCEIDIVSSKYNTIYFTEVKYRKSNTAGGGMAAITPAKVRQMTFAAEYFALRHSLHAVGLQLAGAEVEGDNFTLLQWTHIR